MRYVGDKVEDKYGGHGPSVTGEAVELANDSSDDEGNGIAAGAKVHIRTVVNMTSDSHQLCNI